MQQLPLDLSQTPAPSLENFVTGSNSEALDVLNQIIGGAPPARIVVLCGPAGCGKSHLLNSIRNRADAIDALESVIDDVNDNNRRIWIADDPTQFTDTEQQHLFNLINLLRARADACLVVSLLQPPTVIDLRDDLRTRLASGLVVLMTLLSDADKATALAQHAQALGLNADQKVLEWLLTFQERDIRHLIAYLEAVDRYALQNRRQLTVPLLREFERKQRSGPAADKIGQ